MCGAFYLCFYCVLSCLSCLLLHPVLLCFLSSVCMLYVYGCFGEINYDDDYYQKISKGPGGACVRRRGAPVSRHNGQSKPAFNYAIETDRKSKIETEK